jgi:hypothetical protein
MMQTPAFQAEQTKVLTNEGNSAENPTMAGMGAIAGIAPGTFPTDAGDPYGQVGGGNAYAHMLQDAQTASIPPGQAEADNPYAFMHMHRWQITTIGQSMGGTIRADHPSDRGLGSRSHRAVAAMNSTKRKTGRRKVSCEYCHLIKKRCDATLTSDCSSCIKKGLECEPHVKQSNKRAPGWSNGGALNFWNKNKQAWNKQTRTASVQTDYGWLREHRVHLTDTHTTQKRQEDTSKRIYVRRTTDYSLDADMYLLVSTRGAQTDHSWLQKQQVAQVDQESAEEEMAGFDDDRGSSKRLRITTAEGSRAGVGSSVLPSTLLGSGVYPSTLLDIKSETLAQRCSRYAAHPITGTRPESGFYGVHEHAHGKWLAKVDYHEGGQSIFLGIFDTREQAAFAFDTEVTVVRAHSCHHPTSNYRPASTNFSSLAAAAQEAAQSEAEQTLLSMASPRVQLRQE